MTTTPNCFVTGTRIRTGRGEVSVENLAAGDCVVLATGGRRPICWIGQRTLRRDEVVFEVWPVRVRAGIFGDGLPKRDLLLSPGHMVLASADADNEGGHLVPIMLLINGSTIERVPVDTVTYWHVELDEHDILLAEGLPVESYLNLGSRAWFDGKDTPLSGPDFVPVGKPLQ